MDRGVIVGGGLIAASFLVAVLLNRSAHEEAAPAKAIPPPPVRVCEDPARRPSGATVAHETKDEKCRHLPAETAQR